MPAVVHGVSQEIAESLRESHWNERVKVQYKYVNNNQVEREVEDISIGRLMSIIWPHYIARGSPEIYQVDSIEDLFD